MYSVRKKGDVITVTEVIHSCRESKLMTFSYNLAEGTRSEDGKHWYKADIKAVQWAVKHYLPKAQEA